jgi:N-acetylglutamate synthase-like GNAT family acetyltransferase
MRTRTFLRRIRPDDLPDLVTLVAQLGHPVHEDRLAHMLALLHDGSEHVAVVAEVDGGVGGLLVLTCRPSLTLQGRVGAVQELVVRPALQRREIGEGLLQYAKGLAVERGLVRLECSVPAVHQPQAGRFLLERGFEVADATTYRWGVLEDKHPRLPMRDAAWPSPPVSA